MTRDDQRAGSAHQKSTGQSKRPRRTESRAGSKQENIATLSMRKTPSNPRRATNQHHRRRATIGSATSGERTRRPGRRNHRASTKALYRAKVIWNYALDEDMRGGRLRGNPSTNHKGGSVLTGLSTFVIWLHSRSGIGSLPICSEVRRPGMSKPMGGSPNDRFSQGVFVHCRIVRGRPQGGTILTRTIGETAIFGTHEGPERNWVVGETVVRRGGGR